MSLHEDAVNRLATQSDSIGRLAQDSGGFAAVVAAFESKDPEAFRWVLDRLGFLPQCDLICEWVRIKLCVLRCIEVCGLPRDKAQAPSLEQFAHAIVRLTSDEKLLRRAVDAVSCGDGSDYRAAISALKLEDFCHLLCSWICSVVYNRVCEIVCTPQSAPLPDAVNEIRAAGKAMAALAAKEKALGAVSSAVVALDCETVRSAIGQAGLTSECEIVCRVICIWRCFWVCRELCELPPRVLTGAYAVEEARNFALALRQLANQPRVLSDLVSAVQSRNATAYGEIVARFGLRPYCLQVCAWVCSVTCFEFCICICPKPALEPLFTQVGNFEIYGEIDPATGLTATKLPVTVAMPFGGGPNFAFWDQLTLIGFCPIFSPTSPGTQMRYRFLYATVTTTLAAAISASQTSISVASGAGVPVTPFNVSICNPDESVETAEVMTVTGISGATWTVVRAQQGTTAAAAPAGATVGIGTAPITGSLVAPVQAGTRPSPVPWPTNAAGIAALPLVPGIFEAVWVVPPLPAPAPPFTAPPDPAPPAIGSPWSPPIHNITPDANGWIPVDEGLIAGCVTTLLGFDTTQPQVAPGTALTIPPIDTPGGAPAGTAVPPASQGVGTNLSIVFEATRVGVATIDYSNSLCKIRVNNFSEVNNLWFLEFTTGSSGCCTPIVATLDVQFTVDHEEMNAGAWSLSVTSCSPSAPGDITPAVSGPGVTVTPRGGSGTIVENTGGVTTTLAGAISAAQTSIHVASSAGFPATPFNAWICNTGETVSVTSVSGTTWTVVRGQAGSTAAAAASGDTVSTAWCNCSYLATLSTRPGVTTGMGDRTAIDTLLTFCICGN